MATADTRTYNVDTKGRLKLNKSKPKQPIRSLVTSIEEKIKEFDKITPEPQEQIEYVAIPELVKQVALQTQIYSIILIAGMCFGFAICHLLQSM